MYFAEDSENKQFNFVMMVAKLLPVSHLITVLVNMVIKCTTLHTTVCSKVNVHTY